MPGLTERRHRQTRADIAGAAITLFTQRGFDDVTMEDVAEAAGTSRRTVYRHFPSKEELVFEHPRDWIELFDQIVADEQSPGVDVCLRALRSVAARIDETAGEVFTAYQVYLGTPSLRGIRGRLDDEVFGRFYDLVEADLGDAEDRVVTAAIMSGTLVGTLNGAIAAWVLRWPDRSMSELVEQGLTRIEPILRDHGTNEVTGDRDADHPINVVNPDVGPGS
jgi:AcrR family transcriptional regulator